MKQANNSYLGTKQVNNSYSTTEDLPQENNQYPDSVSSNHSKITLAFARKRLNITLTKAGEHVGVSDTTIGNWEENSADEIRLKYLLKLCKLYHIELSDLFLGTQKQFETEVLKIHESEDHD
jgi:DNA-binding XRE family transcriptional regulator